MFRKIGDLVTLVAVALGAVVASRALGATADQVASAAGGASDMLGAVSSNPKAFAAAAWGMWEVFRRVWPTVRPASPTFTVIAQVCVLFIAILSLVRDFALTMRNADAFQRLKSDPLPPVNVPVSPEDKP